MGLAFPGSRLGAESSMLQVTKELYGRPNFLSTLLAPSPVLQTSQREPYALVIVKSSLTCCRKIWDCNSGEALHSFAHNHIVRSVALNPQQSSQYLLTVSSPFSSVRKQSSCYSRAETRRRSGCSI